MRDSVSRRIIGRSTVAAVATDGQNRLLHTNAAARELFDWSQQEDLKGGSFFSLVEARDSFGNRLPEEPFDLHRIVTLGEPVRGFEIIAPDRSGEGRRIAVSVVIVLTADGESEEFVYYLRPILRRRRADEAIERILAGESPRERRSVGTGSRARRLTRRQRQILRLVADGMRNEEIAEALGISRFTVRSHLRNIFRTLNARTRLEAVSLGLRERLF